MWWANKTQKATLGRILANRQLNNDAALKLVSLDALRRQWQTASKIQDTFSKFMPERASLVVLPARIAALGESVGVSANASFGLEEAKTNNKPSSIELSIFLNGKPQALESFLAEFERLYPLMSITTLDLAQAVEADKLQGVAKVKVYFVP